MAERQRKIDEQREEASHRGPRAQLSPAAYFDIPVLAAEAPSKVCTCLR